ncbi:hypothetical protein J6590_026496 [Homalodisca vitripennis]|nr:hypothetical protein J6590_026496 [Homalodisca vitripennis]
MESTYELNNNASASGRSPGGNLNETSFVPLFTRDYANNTSLVRPGGPSLPRVRVNQQEARARASQSGQTELSRERSRNYPPRREHKAPQTPSWPEAHNDNGAFCHY